MIEDYKFGIIKVSGTKYRSDVIIYPDHIDAQWWRKDGHKLDRDDIRTAIEAKPEVIIIGTGNPGLLKVDKDTLNSLQAAGIHVLVMTTEKACQEYNRIAPVTKVIACLHLTC